MKAGKVRQLNPEGRLDENAARIVLTRVDELRSFAPVALTADGAEAQHDMRIAAKRLRYVLEITGTCFGAPAEKARRRARDLQELLGDLHDCDVMLPRAQAEIDRLRAEDAQSVLSGAGESSDLDPGLVVRAPHRDAYRGLELLSIHLRARRALLFERFCGFWRAEEEGGTWEQLRQAAQAPLEAEFSTF